MSRLAPVVLSGIWGIFFVASGCSGSARQFGSAGGAPGDGGAPGGTPTGGSGGTPTGGSGNGGNSQAGTSGVTGGAQGEAGSPDLSQAGASDTGGGAPATSCGPDHPCDAGKGPCTGDQDCATGLACGVGAGPKFGLAGNVCLPKHCTNDITDGGETSQDCGGGCGCAVFEVLSDYASCGWDTNQDGTVVVGSESQVPSAPQATRWTGKQSRVNLPYLVASTPGGALAEAVSADGNTVVGYATPGPNSTADEVVSWKANLWTVNDLGAVPAAAPTGTAFGVSADGTVIAGESGTGAISSHEAFIWMQQSGYQLLGFVDGGQLDPSLRFSAAFAISGDGLVVVGGSFDATDSGVPFRWTQVGGMQALPKLPSGGSGHGQANSANGDGSVVVGYEEGASGLEAFVWTSKIMQGLGDLSGGQFSSTAYDVSADGTRVVGVGSTDANPTGEAFFWDGAGGMRTLKDAMKEHGFEDPLASWTFQSARAISGDGKVVVGCVIDASGALGQPQAFRVRLEP